MQSWGCSGAGNASAELSKGEKLGEGCRGTSLSPSTPSLPEGESLAPAPEQPQLSMDMNLMAQEKESRISAQKWSIHVFPGA